MRYEVVEVRDEGGGARYEGGEVMDEGLGTKGE